MSKHFALNLGQFLIALLVMAGASLLTPKVYAQAPSTQSTARTAEQMYQVLAAEIALQRGEIGAAYQTYMSLARSSRDPRTAQRAMEIAIGANSPGSSLEAAKLWDELSPLNDLTPKEVYITLLMLNNRWGDAIEPANNFLKRSPAKNRDKYLNQWRSIINKAPNTNEAIRAMGLIIGGSAPLTKDPELLFIYALAEEKAKRFESMEKILRSMIKRNPNDKNALNALGYSFADRNVRLNEAYQLISKAYKLSGGEAYILDSLAWVNFRMGKLDLAAAQLRQAWATKPEPEMGAHLGEVLWALGDKEGADSIWKQTQAMDANDPTLKDTLRRLRPEWTMPEAFDHTIKRKWDGRFAVKVNGQQSQDGGSGSFTLDHESLNDVLELRGPMGVSLARVNVGPAGASLEQNGRVTEAIDADSLVQQVLGMPLPARGLSAWLSGYIRPGSPGTVERDINGNVSKIIQDGWTLNYTWTKEKKLQRLTMIRKTELGDVDIRLVFDYIDE